MRKLTKRQYHYQVSPEIHRELDLARCAFARLVAIAYKLFDPKAGQR